MVFGRIGISHTVQSNNPSVAGITCTLTHPVPGVIATVGVEFFGDAIFVCQVVLQFLLCLSMQFDVFGVCSML